MPSLPDECLAIPKGSTILVTGVNGFIGSHVANELLQYGYHVRGTVRDVSKSAWTKHLFDKQYGENKFTLFPVVDLTLPDAFTEAVKGVFAVVHVASPLSWGSDAIDMVANAVAGAMNTLKAANAHPSVKRFVLTSSSVAASFPCPEQEGRVVMKDSWNDEAVKMSQDLSSPAQWYATYAASKTQAEKAVWEFYHKDQTCRPDLVVNTVLPSTNFGKSLDPVNQGHQSTSSFLLSLWNGTDLERLMSIPPQYFVDVQDTARLHVAATILPGVQDERIFAWAEPWNFNALLAILRHQNPGKTFIDDFQSAQDMSDVAKPRARSVQLLTVLGKSGFTSLADSIRGNTEDLV
ncbi:unnamed protein product [Clonostachys rosea]|uniref:NAD-dependent epimerase/dehydratase domain-containing protein n=1 Tax=Bionectria ochroleuca TaxID=29856 RepID=A0ABY6U698_BIOOC|nr:unnamed protein product [Clonostachys rosea]